MQFTSVVFLLFFLPVALIVHFALSFSRKAQNYWLLLASLLFYAWGEPVWCGVLFVLIVANYLFGLALGAFQDDRKTAKILVICAICVNVASLVAFRYLAFLLGVVDAILPVDMGQIISNLPQLVGVSFFTLQGISYVVDVYRKKITAEQKFLPLATYMAFFPKLTGGPLVSYQEMHEQMEKREVNWASCSAGLSRFATGFAKRILLAGTMGVIADRVFYMSALSRDVLTVPAALAWVGLIAFALQFYHSFSGQADMAIGLGTMFGYTFRENFIHPYAASSVNAFWSRWHVSLTDWFHDYVYLSLGGEKVVSNDQMVRNLFIVCLLTGLWYCADWTFLLWGSWMFVFMIIEKNIAYEERAIPPLVKHVYTLLVVCLGWVLLRTTDFGQSLSYFSNLFGLSQNGFYSDLALILLRENALWFIAAVIFASPVAKRFQTMVEARLMGRWSTVLLAVYPFAVGIVFLLAVLYLATGRYTGTVWTTY